MNMDWLANPRITTVKGRIPFTRDLSSKMIQKLSCNSACKKDVVSSRKYVDDGGEYFGLMPRSKSKAHTDIALFQEDKILTQ